MDTVAIVHDVSRSKHRHVLLHIYSIKVVPDQAALHVILFIIIATFYFTIMGSQ